MQEETILMTQRLILRPWRETDAEALFEYASNPEVGPNAGWIPHTDISYSRAVIRTVLDRKGSFAIVPMQNNNEPIGSIAIVSGESKARGRLEAEGELGYWLGRPYWGKGIIPEAVQEVLRYGFEELGLHRIWCAYYDGNDRSRRVMEKCGFVYDHTNMQSFNPMLQESRIEHFTTMPYELWRKKNGNSF